MSKLTYSPDAMRQFDIRFSTDPKVDDKYNRRQNTYMAVIATSFDEAIAEVYQRHPTAQIWSVSHTHRWHTDHSLVISKAALQRMTQDAQP